MALEQLESVLGDGAKVLDVGSGSGYLTAVLAELVGGSGRVIGIERLQQLSEFGRRNVEKGNSDLLARLKFVYVRLLILFPDLEIFIEWKINENP